MKRFFLISLLMVFGLFAGTSSLNAQGAHWAFSTTTYSTQAPVQAIIKLDGVVLQNTAVELGAFCDSPVSEECRGTFYPPQVITLPPALGGNTVYLYMLPVWGEIGHQIYFKIYNHDTETEYNAVCNTTYSLTEDGAGTIVAPFEVEFSSIYQITVQANPTTGGTVSGGGEFGAGESCTVTATANTGYAFVNWTKGGAVVSTNPTYTFDVTETATLVANFAPTYTVTTSCNPTGAGTVTGGGANFSAGATCTLTATANAGYDFVWWTVNGSFVSDVNPYTFTVTEDVEVVANFSSEVLVITPISYPSTGGTIALTGATVGENGFHYNDPCTLTATAAAGYNFVKWTLDDVDGEEVLTNPYTFNVTLGRNVYAHFQEVAGTYTVTTACNPTAGGTVTGAGTYDGGTSCTLTATANAGYNFVWWTVGGSFVSDQNPYTFTVTEDVEVVACFSDEVLFITPICNPSMGGTITLTGATEGENGFHYNEPCTLTATPATGYSFVKWTDDDFDNVLSTSLSYTFNVIEGGNRFAHFTEGVVTYTVTATVNPDGAGTVTGAGDFNGGEECTLTATANPGYEFACWAIGGSPVSSANPYTFTVTGNVTLEAMFTAEVYNIAVFANPTAGGTVTGGGAFNYGQSCTLEATPNTGYTFIKWTDDNFDNILSTNATYTFTVTAGGNRFAHFVEGTTTYTVTTTVVPDGAGTVTGGGVFNAGEECTVTATANEGYQFACWAIDGSPISAPNPYTFTVTGDVTLQAMFTAETYTIAVFANPSFGGTVTGAGGYTYGQTCVLTASPADGYVFTKWTRDGVDIAGATEPVYTFVVTEGGNYEANFVPGITVNITIEGGEGTVTGAGAYAYGDDVTIGAFANPGYTFLYWEIAGEQIEDNPYTFTATVDLTIIAHFSQDIYTIVAYPNPTGGGTVSQSGTTFTYGQECTLTAVANEDFTFVSWTKEDVVVSTDATYTFEVTESGTYMANFIQGFLITAECVPEIAGTITGAGPYLDGETCTLTAIPANDHFSFVYWSLDGEMISMNATISFTVTESAHYVAYFSYDEFIVNAYANPSFAGETTVSGGIDGNIFMYDQVCTLTATANYGYTFTNWTLNGIEVSTDATYTFNVTESGDYMANFTENDQYTITVEANPADGGVVDGGGVYYVGEDCTITAVANPGFTFNSWTLDGVVVSLDPTYTFTVTEDATYVANFSSNLYYIAVDVTPAIGGTVTGVIPGAFYPYGHWCILEAVANVGYSFDYWTMDGEWYSDDNYIAFIVTDDHDMVAHFSQNGYVITATANPSEGGYITGAGTYTFDQSCTLHAYENAGYTFLNWTLNGEVVSTNAIYTFNVRESGNYVANYEQNMYTITVQANPANAAYVFIQNGQDGQFAYGESCTLRVATPNAGYTFVNWTLNGNVVSTEPTYTFTVTGNADFIANFSVDMLTINATAVPAIGGTVTGGGQYEYGQTCTLTATERNGYTFLRWYKNGVVVSTDPTYTFTVTGNANCVALFTNRAVYITASISTREEGGVITGTGVYEEGEMVTMNVTPSNGYNFVEWLEDGKPLTTEQQFSFVAEYDRSFVAVVREYTDVNENNSVMVTVYPNPAVNTLTVSTDQAEYQLDIFTITGALVRTISNCSNDTQIDVENLTAGSYIIRLTNGNIVETRRFVKK